MEMSTRLQKLEKDLNLISTIQNILTSDDNGQTNLQNLNLRQNFSQEVPERDSNEQFQNHTHLLPTNAAVRIGNKTNVNKYCQKSTVPITKHNKVCQAPVNYNITNVQRNGSLAIRTEEPVRAEILGNEILEKVEEERKRRMEVEESAGRVALKLQKTEDELQRERETRKNLLVGTLELKNQLQGYENRISHLESEISSTKSEKQSLTSTLEKTNQEKLKIEQDFHLQLQLLEKDKSILEKRNQEIQEEFRILQERCDSLKKDCQRKEESLSLQDQRLATQLDQALAKSVQIEQEKEQLTIQLKKSISKLNSLKEDSESKISNYKLLEENANSELLDKTRKIKRLESDTERERVRLESQITSAANLVSRTKSFVISLQQQRDNSLKELRNLKDKYKTLFKEKERFDNNEINLTQEISVLKERLANILKNNLEKGRKSLEERGRIDTEFNNLKVEKEQASRTVELLTNQMDILKRNNNDERKSFQAEIDSLKSEVKRITDNFQVLKKISEDQGRTIAKQRGDLDSSQNLVHSLEVRLREAQETEKALSHQLSSEQKSNQDLESQILQLESQLNSMEEDLRHHNCEDFVDSKWKSRVDELEMDQTSWQRSLRSLEKERDLALTAARKALRQTEEMKDSCETRILKCKSSSAQQVLKLEDEKHELMKEKSKKIQDLESELVQLKQTSIQMQRAYSAKIHQLQTALNACVANTNPSFANIGGFGDIGNGSFGTFL